MVFKKFDVALRFLTTFESCLQGLTAVVAVFQFVQATHQLASLDFPFSKWQFYREGNEVGAEQTIQLLKKTVDTYLFTLKIVEVSNEKSGAGKYRNCLS